jgi:hypothetical protein
LPASPPDPKVCITARGTRICSPPYHQDATVCDFGAGLTPFVIENLRPSDFIDGTIRFEVLDVDVSGDDAILARTWPPSADVLRSEFRLEFQQ